MTDPSIEILRQWEMFLNTLSRHAGDYNYNSFIRQKGFEVKNMYFDDGQILFGIVTTHKILITYNILYGGYQSCMNHILDEISEIRNSCLANN